MSTYAWQEAAKIEWGIETTVKWWCIFFTTLPLNVVSMIWYGEMMAVWTREDKSKKKALIANRNCWTIKKAYVTVERKCVDIPSWIIIRYLLGRAVVFLRIFERTRSKKKRVLKEEKWTIKLHNIWIGLSDYANTISETIIIDYDK